MGRKHTGARDGARVTKAYAGRRRRRSSTTRPIAPITNIPHWGDTKGDPHGRATELPGLGDAVLQFYETGQIQNPCGGEPCRVLN